MAGKKNKAQYECMADSLAEETLKEAADSFFGQRRSIENALQEYQAKVEQLREIQKEVFRSQATLYFLLRSGNPPTVRGFYTSIGVDPDAVPIPPENTPPDLGCLRVPWGIRTKSRYGALVRETYAEVVQTAHAYMYGRYYNDPENPRCKRVTVHYKQLERMCREITAKIEQANQFNTPSQALQFSKQLNVEQTEKESLAGIPLQYNLDEDMAFVAPDFTCARLDAYPDFPKAKEVDSHIKSYAAELYAQAPKEIETIITTVKKTKPASG
ncbi:hypothetical protein [Desulfohalobium retbaense]|uniref:Uncharacterized protein n=1 Tax=Desulfohalobium retbaense (strain ATCC 49708 / DSM 5692 / JCM 16813 / HR100) TaxID=485915 RepID=C8X2C5_DESRD|nr:hypothetical protein [Desulfohalobium retbaense]ACV68572.1 hypothetical protein Dret_1284 [Desulfohalobium retbaense DSM 5692]